MGRYQKEVFMRRCERLDVEQGICMNITPFFIISHVL